MIYNNSRPEITRALTEAGIDWLIRGKYGAFREIALVPKGRLKVDLIGFSLRGDVVIIEVKSSKQDFAADGKWTKYLPYCHRFYFAVTEHLYRDRTLRDAAKGAGAGIMTLCGDGWMRVSGKAVRRDVPEDILRPIRHRLIWRAATYSARNRRRVRRFINGQQGIDGAATPGGGAAARGD